ARALGLWRGIGWCLRHLANVALARADFERVTDLCEQAMAVFEERRATCNSADARDATWGIAKVVEGLAHAELLQGNFARAGPLLERSLELHRAVGDTREEGWTLLNLGAMAAKQGEYQQAVKHLESGLRVHRELGDQAGIAQGLYHLAEVAVERGEHGRAWELYEESLQLFREAGQTPGVYHNLVELGGLELLRGDASRAVVLYEEAIQARRAAGRRAGIAHALCGIGMAALAQGDHERARELLEESLALNRERRDKPHLPVPLEGLGLLACREGEYDRAEALFDEALSLYREMGAVPGVARLLTRIGAARLFRNDLDDASRHAREALGLYREIGGGTGRDDCLEVLAAVAVVRGQPERAVRLFGTVDAMRAAWDIRSHLSDHPMVAQGRVAACASLGVPASERAHAAGRAMMPEQAVEYVLGGEEPATHRGHTGPCQETSATGGATPLSARELEVAALIARGFTDRRIASELGLSERTVHSHVRRILSRLGLESRAQVAVWAAERRLLPSGPTQ
ncbi:MAG: tetratricopeptide repeat protein, partial [Actinomycetota bacterium]|nr:tetratricopeptide repeat protein [Actinomycetota bacterium]